MNATRLTLCQRAPRPAKIIAEVIESHGFVVTPAMDRDLDVSAADVVWIAGNMNWFPKVRRSLLEAPPSKRPFVIVWHWEPLPLPSAAGLPTPRPNLHEIAWIILRDSRATDMGTNYRRIREMARHGIPDLLVVSSQSRQEFLAEHGISSHFVPMGHHAGLGRDLGTARDIDALFVGGLNDPGHRRALKQLRRKGLSPVVRGAVNGKGGLWGEERTKLINRANVFLNLQRHPGKLSGMRMLLGMTNRALMMSEPIYDPTPYVPGIHYVSVALDGMPDAIRYYLRNDAERKRIADEGHRFVTTELTMERSIAEILRLSGQV